MINKLFKFQEIASKSPLSSMKENPQIKSFLQNAAEEVGAWLLTGAFFTLIIRFVAGIF